MKIAASLLILVMSSMSVGQAVAPQPPPAIVKRKAEEQNKLLARLTVYWAKGPGTDYWSRRRRSATGVRLKEGHCAVDPDRIPYFTKLNVQGVGTLLAVDTGTDVIGRKAARRAARNKKERQAIVVDIFYMTRDEALEAAETLPKFAMVSWNK